MQDSDRSARSFAELFGEFGGNLSLLFKQHAALAKEEFGQMFAQVLLGLVVFVLGALVVSVGLVVLLCAVVLALALVMPHWAAALIVGLVFVLGGGLALYFGVMRLGRLKLVPERTARSLKDSAAMFRETLR